MKTFLTLFLFIFGSCSLFSQFDIEAYREYLNSHEDMPADSLLIEYPAGLFEKHAKTDFLKAEYANRIAEAYQFGDDEINLINKHGFMVTKKNPYENTLKAFFEIYHKDLPVYISTDAILYALHYSYGEILESLESRHINNELQYSLNKLKDKTQYLAGLSSDSIYQLAVKDFDLYLSVACNLGGSGNSKPFFSENFVLFNDILKNIESDSCKEIRLFSDAVRKYDFSQFKIRGHYTKSKELQEYFRTMTWLGRTDIYITAPEHQKGDPKYQHSKKDLQRQAILASLFAEAARLEGQFFILKDIIDKLLEYMIARQDNITLFEVDSIIKETGINHAYELTDTNNYKKFKTNLLKLASSKQLYNSQILFSDVMNPKQVEPPSVFLLMGQRPVIDGFITSKVTYDDILYKNEKIPRMLPSSQDLLFALGNDASAQLLESELKRYNYADNLCALRYLIDSYDSTYWKSSYYTRWLNGIRTLNPPLERSHLPRFMQTAAWWQKSMSTQLASWAQLRHDYILYAKQPYTDALLCSFPEGYVEPRPEFYASIKNIFKDLYTMLDNINYFDYKLSEFSQNWYDACSKLEEISYKELRNQDLNEDEKTFLKSLINIIPLCSQWKEGWYSKMHYNLIIQYNFPNPEKNFPYTVKDYTIADVHTSPTDESGNEVGWVMHAGTGPINLAVVVAEDTCGNSKAFIGPVMSYYETITEDYVRLTDEEWLELYNNPSSVRPEFTDLYIAGKAKHGKEPLSLRIKDETSVDDTKETLNTLHSFAFPAPATGTVNISFRAPSLLSESSFKISIYDIGGSLVKLLVDKTFDQGNYVIKWDGRDLSGNEMPAGTYIYLIENGNESESGKIVLQR